MFKNILLILFLLTALLSGSEKETSSPLRLSSLPDLYTPDWSWYETDRAPFPRPLLNLRDLPEKYQTIARGFPILQTMGMTVMGVIYSLPSETSNWDKETFKSHPLWWNWHYNVTRGPVFDNDSFLINYIEHPYVGSAYYVWGRGAGLSRKESAALSILLSMVYWEYGWEALIEPPSWQDLIVTPLVGSFIGEGVWQLKQKIDAKGGTIYGSRFLGSLGKILLDPIGEANHGLQHLLKKHHIRTDTQLEVFFRQQRDSLHNPHLSRLLPERRSNRSGLRVHIRF